MSIREVVFISGARTAIGSFGGALKDVAPTRLASHVVRGAISRGRVDAAEIGSCVFGNVIHTEPRDMYLGRVAAIEGGLPIDTPAMTLNRLCGSGLQAIVSAAQQIMLGDTNLAVAGGAESMSRGMYALPSARWGQKTGSVQAVDMMVGSLHDPFGNGHMGITAENVAAKWNISREEQDAFAAESHVRATNAQAERRFNDEILPIEIETRKGGSIFCVDEQVRADVSPESLRSLKPVFKKDGSVTAGNASSINDGAAALVLCEGALAAKKGLKPRARMVAYAHAAVEPSEMGIGPVPAVQNVLRTSGLRIDDMDLIESNEAFAAQALAVSKELGLPRDKTNPNGGAIALGHPIGATGAILAVKTIYELQRTRRRYGLIAMCIGGGQGIAMIIESFGASS